MAVAIRGYFDGSGQENDDQVTLAGYVASPEVWATFEERWLRVLRAFEPPCAYFHMVEAKGLRGKFSIGKGWSKARVDSLIQDLIHQCFLPAAWNGPDGPSLLKVFCTIGRTDWERSCQEVPQLREHSRATVCARYVAEAALRRLPQDPDKPEGHRTGTLELYFDQNEPFLPQIKAAWRNALTRPKGRRGPLSMISDIVPAEMRTSPGLQAADFLAWHINRWRTKDCQRSWWRTFKSCPGIGVQFRSSDIVEWHKAGYDGSLLRFGQ